MKILCYAPYNAWALHGLWEMTILHSLKLRGAEFLYVMCDGIYSECDIHWKATNPRHELSCDLCRKQTAEFVTGMGIPYQVIGQFLGANDFKMAEAWAESLSLHDYMTAEYQGWEVGAWVKSSVHSHFRMSQLDLGIPEIRQVFQRYLYSGLIACIGIDRLLDDYRPDLLFLFNGRMSSPRVALSLAQSKGIRTITHERGFLKESLLLKENGSCLDLRPIKQIWTDWGAVPLNGTELAEITSHLNAREQGQNMSWKSFSPSVQPLTLVRQRLNIPEQCPVWVLFTSSDDEIIAAEGYEGAFACQHEWISRSADYVANHPGIRLIVRVHPNTAGKNATGNNQQQLEALKALSARYPDNISFIMPEDDISSYSLMEIANLGLVYQSTVGLEMACKGKSVLVSAGSMISGLPFVTTIQRENEYEATLEQFLGLPPDYVSMEVARLAHRYAYGFYFRYNIPFPLVTMPDPHNGLLAYSNTDDLLPGKDPHLDRIARIILEHEPVCPGPDASRKSGSTQEEDTRFTLKFLPALPSGPDRAARVTRPGHPLISVIIPCYNYGHYLTAAVVSILKQSFQDFELIIVDDGSSDDSVAVARSLIERYPEHDITLIPIANSGTGNPAFPRNHGVREGRGEYILFVDADDMIMPTMLEECLDLLEKHPEISIAYTDHTLFDAQAQWTMTTPEYDFRTLLVNNQLAYCSLFRRKAWEDAGGVPTDMGYEDWDFWITCGTKGHFARRIPRPLFCYRQHETGRFKNELVVRDALLRAQILRKHPEYFAPEVVRSACEFLDASKEHALPSCKATESGGDIWREGISFCIITDGKRSEKLIQEINSIKALNIPKYEILIGGELPPDFSRDGITFVPAVAAARAGRLGEMRNRLVEEARFGLLVVADDDLIFQSDFYSGLQKKGNDFDVLCVRFFNVDGSRYWGWATIGGPKGHVLLEFRDTDPYLYVTGGLCIMKSWVAAKVKWDAVRGMNQMEDVDFSRALQAAGVRIELCPDATVIHNDWRQIQAGSKVYRIDVDLEKAADFFFAQSWEEGMKFMARVFRTFPGDTGLKQRANALAVQYHPVGGRAQG